MESFGTIIAVVAALLTVVALAAPAMWSMARMKTRLEGVQDSVIALTERVKIIEERLLKLENPSPEAKVEQVAN